jgi:hypothetical protein
MGLFPHRALPYGQILKQRAEILAVSQKAVEHHQVHAFSQAPWTRYNLRILGIFQKALNENALVHKKLAVSNSLWKV